jgi:hypothetical protein
VCVYGQLGDVVSHDIEPIQQSSKLGDTAVGRHVQCKRGVVPGRCGESRRCCFQPGRVGEPHPYVPAGHLTLELVSRTLRHVLP